MHKNNTNPLRKGKNTRYIVRQKRTFNPTLSTDDNSGIKVRTASEPLLGIGWVIYRVLCQCKQKRVTLCVTLYYKRRVSVKRGSPSFFILATTNAKNIQNIVVSFLRLGLLVLFRFCSLQFFL